jgi:hypothetical protein
MYGSMAESGKTNTGFQLPKLRQLVQLCYENMFCLAFCWFDESSNYSSVSH